MEWLVIIQKMLASSFIVLTGILLLAWSLPDGYFFRDFLHTKLGKYIRWASLDTYWALFAPQPISRNHLISFEIELVNGTVHPWKLPEYTIRNEYQRTRHFRYIKMHNQLLSQKDPIPKEAICKFVIQEFCKGHKAENNPARVHIMRYYEPSSPDVLALFPWLSQRIYTYDVTAEPQLTGS